MPEVDDLSRSITIFDQARTLLVVVEMSQSSWLVAGMVPGLERLPLKKLDPDPAGLVRLIERWRSEAGRPIDRIALAFEAGRDGFWLARWLRECGIMSSTRQALPSPASTVARRPTGWIRRC